MKANNPVTRRVRPSTLVLAAAACFGAGVPVVASAQQAWSGVEHVAAAPGTYRLHGPGLPKSRTIALGEVGKTVSFPVKGVVYDIKTTVVAGADPATVAGTAELLDADGRVLLRKEASAKASEGAPGALDIRLYASFVRNATAMRITYEALGGTDVSIAGVSVDRTVASREIIEIDFD